MTWGRIEIMGRSLDLVDGVKARIADPFWMMGRQWQVGEFRGDDAARPLAVQLGWETATLTSFRSDGPGSNDLVTIQDRTLVRLAGQAPISDSGFAGVHAAAASGAELVAILKAFGQTHLIDWLYENCRFDALPDKLALAPQSKAALRLLTRRGIDARKAYGGQLGRLRNQIKKITSKTKRRAVRTAVDAWVDAHPSTTPSTWTPSELEHQFSLGGWAGDEEIALQAKEYDGQTLDWYDFDVTPETIGASLPQKPTNSKPPEITVLPTPAAYAGMPSAGWWSIEDRAVHFGDIQSGPGDFAKLMVAEFATTFSDDWFVVPLRVKQGTLTRITSLKVWDNFLDALPNPDKQPLDIAHIGVLDNGPLPRSADFRPFKLFELSGDPSVRNLAAPWLFTPLHYGTPKQGPVIESVTFTRDEAANLAWAIERTVAGPLGRALDRGVEWSANPPASPRGASDWTYRLTPATPPPWWIPFLAVPRDKDLIDTVLRRGRMDTWEDGQDHLFGPVSTLLVPDNNPFVVEEAQVPRSGVTIEKRWVSVRGHNGQTEVWEQFITSPGRGETASTIRWDALDT